MTRRRTEAVHPSTAHRSGGGPRNAAATATPPGERHPRTAYADREASNVSAIQYLPRVPLSAGIDPEIYRAAVHQAGHAVIAFVVNEPLSRICIPANARPQSCPFAYRRRLGVKALDYPLPEGMAASIYSKCQILLAGHAAEAAVFGIRRIPFDDPELAKAVQQARRLPPVILGYGTEAGEQGPSILDPHLDCAYAIILGLAARMRDSNEWPRPYLTAVHALADALTVSHSLDWSAANACILQALNEPGPVRGQATRGVRRGMRTTGR